MKTKSRHITIFEHQPLRLRPDKNGKKLERDQLEALQRYYGEKGVPYFTLIHQGVCFNAYVGVLQVGNTLIEVLPKADKYEDQEAKWRNMLLGMLKAVGAFDIHAPSSSSLKLKPNSILDLYFELFVEQVEYLLHLGLIKKYRKKEGNVTALKGNLLFGKHIQQNLTHQERFYVRHSTYDVEHLLHQILYETLQLLWQINTQAALQSRIGALLLYFPEMPVIKVSEASFNKLVFTRKNQSYKKAIDIAKLLLLRYHPDIKSGKNDVLALMFDMNLLWEEFVYVSLKRKLETGSIIHKQSSELFWKPNGGRSSKIRPDIVWRKDDECVVLDTKWKNLNGGNPSPDDLRQMYVYHDYFGAKRVAVIYPGNPTNGKKGNFHPSSQYKKMDRECSVMSIDVNPDIRAWQKEIASNIQFWKDNDENE